MSSVEPPASWAAGAAEGAEVDRRLTRVVRAVPEPAALPEFARRRVAARLRRPARNGARLLLARLVAVGVVIGVGSAAAAQWAATRWFGPQRELITPPVRSSAQTALVPQPSLPRVLQAPAAPEPEIIAREVAQARPSAAAFPLPASSSQLGLEASSLEAALTALRGGGTARAAQALHLLDEHAKRFPAGALELEARVARVDALLTLGRRHEARRELSTLPIERVGRKQELRLIRAELRADDDCAAALVDFSVLVEQTLPAGLAERALFGRGACRLRSGDAAGAERDFSRYLERFPDGRFAASIRAQRDH